MLFNHTNIIAVADSNLVATDVLWLRLLVNYSLNAILFKYIY